MPFIWILAAISPDSGFCCPSPHLIFMMVMLGDCSMRVFSPPYLKVSSFLDLGMSCGSGESFGVSLAKPICPVAGE